MVLFMDLNGELMISRYSDHVRWVSRFVPFVVSIFLLQARGMQTLQMNYAPSTSISPQRAEQKLKRILELPTRQAPFIPPIRELETIEQSFQQWIQKHGGSLRTYTGLAKTRMAQGDYAGATQAYRQALKYSPQSKSLQSDYKHAGECLNIFRKVSSSLPNRHQVIQVHKYPRNDTPAYWLVASAIVHHGKSYPDIKDLRLTLYQRTATTLKKIWQSQVLQDIRFAGGELNDLQLFITDLTRDGIPEVVVHKIIAGVSWLPSHLNVFEWHHDRLVEVLDLSSSFPLWIEDINCDGRYEIGNCYEIGWGIAHVDQPLWTDIYAYYNGRYRLANDRFPQEFKEWPHLLQKTLERHPNDYQIHKYLAISYEIGRQPGKALISYRAAERACRREILDTKDKDFRLELERDLSAIQGKIAHLTGKS
jgi:tetratricopeptide (TPR) repeat protein